MLLMREVGVIQALRGQRFDDGRKLAAAVAVAGTDYFGIPHRLRQDIRLGAEGQTDVDRSPDAASRSS